MVTIMIVPKVASKCAANALKTVNCARLKINVTNANLHFLKTLTEQFLENNFASKFALICKETLNTMTLFKANALYVHLRSHELVQA
jgi:hypothetical protein